MNAINITKINLDTPVLASYIKRMSNWGENGAFCSKAVAKKDADTNFYGIFYNENFLAASVIEHDESQSSAYVTMANGSLNHFKEIEDISRPELINIAKSLYGEETTVFFPTPAVKKLAQR